MGVSNKRCRQIGIILRTHTFRGGINLHKERKDKPVATHATEKGGEMEGAGFGIQ